MDTLALHAANLMLGAFLIGFGVGVYALTPLVLGSVCIGISGSGLWRIFRCLDGTIYRGEI